MPKMMLDVTLSRRWWALLLLFSSGFAAASVNKLPSLSCCSVLESNDHTSLLKCLNDSATYQYVKKLSQATTQPSLSVAYVSRITPEVSLYGAYSRMVQNLYAERNDYVMLPLWKDSSRADYRYHRKLVPLIDTLRSVELFSDYVAWIDADLIPLDIKFRVERIAAQYPQAHILLSADVSSVANTGFIIVKGSSPWAENFLEDWLAQMLTPGMETEQMGFEAVYRSRKAEEMQSKVAILPSHMLNSVATPMGQQLPHHQILHLAAESASMRAAVFKKAATNLCSALASGKEPPPQLGITRKYLQNTAKQVYGVSFQRLEEQIVLHANTVSVSELAEYRTSASKYCYAENYSQNFTETPRVLQLRARAHIIATNFTLTRVRDLAVHAANYTLLRAVSGADSAVSEVMRDSLTRPDVSDWSIHEDLVGYTDAMRAAVDEHSDVAVRALQSYAVAVRPLLTRLPPHGCGLPHFPSDGPGARSVDDPSCAEIVFYQAWQELPETIKLAAEISHDLLVAILSTPGPELPRPNIFSPIAEVVDELPPHRDPRLVENLLKTIEFYLKLLNKTVHPSQLQVVEGMTRDMDSLLPKIKALML